ncbi:MAG TPA: peptidoglycan glycosyltransferase, partial [Firmicutes bacterium]|nr:peptidoglycan glycosyltransferase [Bacillota bacterium]
MVRDTTSNLHIRRRLLFIFFITFLIMVALVLRLGWVQFVMAEDLQKKAWEQWNRSIPTRSSRGNIYDRNGQLLAGSATVETIVAVPPQIENPSFTARALAPVLEMNEERIYELITQKRAAVYIKRKVDEEVAKEVRLLNLPGITFTHET